MGGDNFSDVELNIVLKKIIELLYENEIDDWFISYGSLLGIVRNNSCINNDDDIDIIINIKHIAKLKEIFIKNKYKFIYDCKNFFKIEMEQNKPTVDFYFSNVDENNNFNDTWNQVIWTNAKPFIKKNWNDVSLVLPNDYEKKLIGRYGNDWKIPKQSKGINPPKKVL